MIISRYLTKEVLGTLLAVTLVLLLVFLSQQLVRYLSYAASGKLGANILFQLMGFEIPYLLALLLPLGLYLGILLAYSRMYADNEMTVLHACGFSINRLVVITSSFTVVLALIVLVLTLWVNPWLAAQKDQLIAQSISTDNILDTLMPGRFQVSSDGRRVLYVERINRSRKQATNIFIADQGKPIEDGNVSSWTVVSAEHGSQMRDPESQDHFVVATDGFRYEGVPGQNDFKIIQFKKYAARMPQPIMTSKRQQEESVATRTLLKNYHDSESAAEVQWRFSMPISVLMLGLLAIPLSHIRPRRGRYSQLLPALLIYIVYVNTLFIARAWVEQKTLPIGLGMWWVHSIVFIIAGLLLLSQAGFSFNARLRRKT